MNEIKIGYSWVLEYGGDMPPSVSLPFRTLEQCREALANVIAVCAEISVNEAREITETFNPGDTAAPIGDETRTVRIITRAIPY